MELDLQGGNHAVSINQSINQSKIKHFSMKNAHKSVPFFRPKTIMHVSWYYCSTAD